MAALAPVLDIVSKLSPLLNSYSFLFFYNTKAASYSFSFEFLFTNSSCSSQAK